MDTICCLDGDRFHHLLWIWCAEQHGSCSICSFEYCREKLKWLQTNTQPEHWWGSSWERGLPWRCRWVLCQPVKNRKRLNCNQHMQSAAAFVWGIVRRRSCKAGWAKGTLAISSCYAIDFNPFICVWKQRVAFSLVANHQCCYDLMLQKNTFLSLGLQVKSLLLDYRKTVFYGESVKKTAGW